MALSHLGGVSGVVIAAVQSYAANTYVRGPETIPPGYGNVLVALDLRNITSLTTVISWSGEYSIDGGANWVSIGGGGLNVPNSGYTFDGSVLRNSEGGPVRMTGSLRRIPRTDLTRQVRLSFTLNETMTIGATVMVF